MRGKHAPTDRVRLSLIREPFRHHEARSRPALDQCGAAYARTAVAIVRGHILSNGMATRSANVRKTAGVEGDVA